MSITDFASRRSGDRPDGPSGPPDRIPPQDPAAEQCVLGAMMLSKDAIADVVEMLRGNDFYRPAHETVYDAVVDLYGRGEPVDAVTVAAELQRGGELARVGGAPYLHTLVASVPVAANAGYYARIVHEKALLRRLVDAGTRVTQLGYAGEGDVDDVVDRAQAEVYAVTDRRTSEDYQRLADLMEATLDEIEAIGSRGGQLAGVPTGFADLDNLTNGLHAGQLVILAARPSLGKSTAGLDIARSAAIRHGLTSAFFSLEMSRTEITMRLLSAEAKVPLKALRTGSMSDDDWARLARKMGEVSDAPLFIDDSPNLTMMEIRAKARRLKQRHDLRLVVVDYIQLMTSGKRVESRQLEVSEFSRSLKLLAKELDVPVLAISQLNRGPEQRTDKRPLLSDLRESGCLTAGTRLLRADTGAGVSLGELLNAKARDVPVWSLDDRLKLVPRTLTHAFPSGVREAFRVRLASGREVEATANHPFLGHRGWTPLAELGVGSRVAVPRWVPDPLQMTSWPDEEVARLARRQGGDPGVSPAVSSLPVEQVALFLRHLWLTHGCGRRDGCADSDRMYHRSRRVVDDVAQLLQRLGIAARVERVREHDGGVGYHVLPSGVEDEVRFLDRVKVPGLRGRATEAAATTSQQPSGALGTKLRTAVLEPAATSRARLSDVAEILDDEGLDLVATNDVCWDTVIEVTSLGDRDVYDATVLGTHNFIANGVAVHNSLEQDSDMVILLHREEAYDRESARVGEADFIVAKHRNGPTDVVTVAFQGHYSRFVDMAPG